MLSQLLEREKVNWSWWDVIWKTVSVFSYVADNFRTSFWRKCCRSKGALFTPLPLKYKWPVLATVPEKRRGRDRKVQMPVAACEKGSYV